MSEIVEKILIANREHFQTGNSNTVNIINWTLYKSTTLNSIINHQVYQYHTPLPVQYRNSYQRTYAIKMELIFLLFELFRLFSSVTPIENLAGVLNLMLEFHDHNLN